MAHASAEPNRRAFGWNPEGTSPQAQLLMMTAGMRVAQVIYVLAELGIAGLLSDGPQDVPSLAAAASCDPGTLHRLLRAASSVGVFRQNQAGQFELTPTADLLRPDAPGSQLDLIVYNGRTLYPVYGAILHTARTGGPAFPEVFGAPFYECLNAHPEISESVYRAADRMDLDIVEACVAHIDLAKFDVIVDIGGGTGAFLAQLLRDLPHARGIAGPSRSRASQPSGAGTHRHGRSDPSCRWRLLPWPPSRRRPVRPQEHAPLHG